MNQLYSFSEKVAVVTGTSRGNGATIASALLEAGATVYCLQRRAKRENTIDHPRAKVLAVDVTVKGQVKKAIQLIVAQAGRIDILVNNAGITIGNPSERYTLSDWDATMNTNLRAVFFMSQLVAGIMAKRASGVIVNITSINAELGFPGNPAYVASKGGLKQLTKALACDWAKYGIRVNNLGLGYFRTDMTKKSYSDPDLKKQRDQHILLGRWGEPKDLVGPVLFLCSEASRYMTGQDLYIDGGWLAKGL